MMRTIVRQQLEQEDKWGRKTGNSRMGKRYTGITWNKFSMPSSLLLLLWAASRKRATTFVHLLSSALSANAPHAAEVIFDINFQSWKLAALISSGLAFPPLSLARTCALNACHHFRAVKEWNLESYLSVQELPALTYQLGRGTTQ
jgi:hypothetical protein